MAYYSGEELGWVSSVISAIVGVSSEVTKTSKAKYDASIDAAHAAITKEESDAAAVVNEKRRLENEAKITSIVKTGAIITAVVVAAVVLGAKSKGAKR